MRLSILAAGTISGAQAELVKEYQLRGANAFRQIGLDGPHIQDVKPQKLDAAFQTLAQATPDTIFIALDEAGQNITSRAFASQIEQWIASNKAQMCFVLGAADGLPDTIKQRADIGLALGRMTLPHLLARVVLCEQLWRAAAILTRHPYHRD